MNILLAEDNIVNQKLALGILEKLGHHVVVALNGIEALQKIDENEFDMVLMDVQMPEMDGLEATRELRQRESDTHAHVPVVAMTAHAMKGDRERCLAAGMDDYLCKPIRLKDMTDKLAELFPDPDARSPDQASLSSSTITQHDLVVWAEVLESMGGDHQLLQELVTTFLSDGPRLIQQAVEAANQNNTEALREAAHSLKGAMLFLNPVQALQSAQRVEQLAGDGELEASRKSLDDLQKHCADVCDCLKSYQTRNDD